MIIPIRCFTCNKVIAHLWEDYLNKIQMAYIDEDIKNNKKKRFIEIEELENKTIEGKTLDEMNVHRYCCRRMMLSHVDLCNKI
jgi:DNA-directed RNA polymerase I, II, and III subunit RPABC5